MKKKINTDAIMSELRGESVFFHAPTEPVKPPVSQEQSHQEPPPQHRMELPGQEVTAHMDERSYARTSVRRQFTRYAFEFYQDQVNELRRLSLEEKIQGGKGSMSEMVRVAIDEYLERKKHTKK